MDEFDLFIGSVLQFYDNDATIMSSFIIANYVSKHLKIGSVVFSHNQPSHTLFPENIDFQLVLLTLMGELLML